MTISEIYQQKLTNRSYCQNNNEEKEKVSLNNYYNNNDYINYDDKYNIFPDDDAIEFINIENNIVKLQIKDSEKLDIMFD